MNDNSADSRSETTFHAPHVSRLTEQSRELNDRSRVIVDNMTVVLRRVRDAIARSNELMRKKTPLPGKFR